MVETAADTPKGDAPQPVPPNPALKMVVYGMGVLIIIMFVLLLLGLALGWNKKAAPPPAADPLKANATLAPIEIPTAAGSRLYTIAGDGPRIALHIAAPTGDEVIVVDTETNRVVSRIKLMPEGGVVPDKTPPSPGP